MTAPPTLPEDPLDLAELDNRCRWQLRPPQQFPHPSASAWGFDQYGLWQTFLIAGEAYRMRYMAPGSFLMGSPQSELDRFPNETQHAVTLTQGFWLGETTVTQALWWAVMGDNPSRFQPEGSAELPVENVSWDDCEKFFTRVAELEGGIQFTFPTEAQWEYACRAGTRTPFATGDNLATAQADYNGNLPNVGHAKGIDREKTVLVREFSPNPWGLHQMHGNVWEWCLDDLRGYRAQPEIDPLGNLDSRERALRGGSWFDNARGCRSTSRLRSGRDIRSDLIGLRAAMVPASKGERDARLFPAE